MQNTEQKHQGCPRCGCESLTEWTHELASQANVRIDIQGNPDYEKSQTMDIAGSTAKVIGYDCGNCRCSLIICNGKLTEAPVTKGDGHEIRASFSLDKTDAHITFEALPWFATASDNQLLELAQAGFAHDYPADNVAMALAEHIDELRRLFAVHEILGGGFSCSVDPLDAMTWILANRPGIYAALQADQDTHSRTAKAIEHINKTGETQ